MGQINAKKEDGSDADKVNNLVAAVEAGDAEKLEALISERKDVINESRDRGQTLLHFAAKRNQVGCVRVLLQAGAKSNQRNDSYETPLHIAVKNGYGDVLRELCARVENVDEDISNGETSLFVAVRRNDVSAVQILLEAGADVNRTNYGKQTPLNTAVEKGYLDIVRVLISAGVNVNDVCNSETETPLHICVRRGYVECVKILLEAGATCNTTSLGKTPLHVAAALGFPEILQILITHPSANVHIWAKGQAGPLHLATEYHHNRCVEVLLEAGADPNTEDAKGWPPLHIAASHGNDDAVQMLLQAGADANSNNSLGNTALFVSLCRSIYDVEDFNVQRCLLQYGADLEAPCSLPCAHHTSLTPLELALLKDQVSTLHMMIRVGSELKSDLRDRLTLWMEDPEDRRLCKSLQDAYFRQKLSLMATQPPSLKHLTRKFVRRAVINTQGTLESLKYLPLPGELLDVLMMRQLNGLEYQGEQGMLYSVPSFCNTYCARLTADPTRIRPSARWVDYGRRDYRGIIKSPVPYNHY